jgi:ATP-dependent 26S proteasome regulatory subunit
MEYFENSLQHLLAELERIDLLIAGQVARMRRIYARDEQFRGLYISEKEVDALLANPTGDPVWAREVQRSNKVVEQLTAMRTQIDQRLKASSPSGFESRLFRLKQTFGLDPFEIDALLICLAVELDLRYERLYAYLHDDVTKKRPSVDLVLNLLAADSDSKLRAHDYFNASGRLIRHQLLQLLDDPAQPHPPLLARILKVDQRVVQYMLGSNDLDDRLQYCASKASLESLQSKSILEQGLQDKIRKFLATPQTTAGAIFYLRGPYGVGKIQLAASVCMEKKVALLRADLGRIIGDQNLPFDHLVKLLKREAKLQGAAICWQNFDLLRNKAHQEIYHKFMDFLAELPLLTFLAGEDRWQFTKKLRGIPFAEIELSLPSPPVQRRIWSQVIDRQVADSGALDQLSAKFKFSGGQISDAADTAKNLARLRGPGAQIDKEDLYQSCRWHSNQKLAELARKISPVYCWEDIVLPEDQIEQLHEICNYVTYGHRVYGEWGFADKLSQGKGLSVLFAGPSGTGKTMAAEIIAKELGLELYKIDLSAVISKYIGETEKNLARIFQEAETSNAILFFDEADALFGKRSEVKDSHDRYANIETGYLLQRLEEYSGIVILATNLRKNMDDAFVRRIGFTITFPFPMVADRRRIWESIWPTQTPRSPDLDFDYMAHEFEISGGNIKNIVLAAAFLAASENRPVANDHLLRAARREYQKMGKVLVQKKYKECIAIKS